MVDRETSPNPTPENGDEWCSDSDVSDETQTKLQTIKLLVAWLLGAVSRHTESAKPIFRLLSTMLNNDGKFIMLS